MPGAAAKRGALKVPTRTSRSSKGAERTLQDALDVLGGIETHHPHKGAERALETAEAKLRSQTFRIAVLGHFKRGKSTLLNAVLADDLLPTGVLPVTSVITEVRRGPSLNLTVHFLDGRSAQIDRFSLAKYVTEKENPGNEKGVASVDITHPAASMARDIALVDTPGVGSVLLSNTRTTEDFLASADAALFVTSTDPPISAEEVAFVRRIREHAGKVFFVLNKADRLDEPELREALAFTEAVLRDALGINVQIHSMSAKQALDGAIGGDERRLVQSGLPRLMTHVEHFLQEHKRRAQLAAATREVLRAAIALRDTVQLELSTLQASDQDLARIQVDLNSALDAAEVRCGELEHLLRLRADGIVQGLWQDLKKFATDAPPSLQPSFRSAVEDARATDARSLREQARTALRGLVESAVTEWYRSEEEHLRQQFQTVGERLNDETVKLLNQVRSASGGLAGAPEAGRAEALRAMQRQNLFYCLWTHDLEDVSLKTAGMMPNAIERTRELLRERANALVSEELTMNATRAKDDLLDRIGPTVHEIQTRSETRLRETVEALRRSTQEGLRKRTARATTVAKEIRVLEECLNEIAVTRRVGEELLHEMETIL